MCCVFFCSLWNTVRADATQRTHTGTIHEYSPVWKKTTIIFTKTPTKSICINCFTIKSTYLETLLYTELYLYHYIVHIYLEGEKKRLSPSGFTWIFRYDVMIDIVCYFFCRTLIQAWHFILSLNIIFFDKFVTILSYENETFEKKSLYTQEYFYWQLYICGKSSHYLLLFINTSAIFIRILDNRIPCITLSSSILEGSKESFNTLLPGKSR